MSDVPQWLNRFEIVQVLGKGGMGTVYLARDEKLGRQVAVKVLNAAELSSSDARVRFVRESRAAAAIRHPNVATIYEVGETDEGQPFIVMEYCEGETLSQRIRRRPVEAGEFLSIGRQIASALAAAHANGVVHRDIKSANIIIEPRGQVKILDFGLARLTEEPAAEAPSFATTSNRFFGTLHYLSPEQARGTAADARSDLFSAGVVLYQLASGHLPFNGDFPLAVLEKIRVEEPEPFVPLDPAFPQAATSVIRRLLQKEPADRYRDAAELLAALEAIDIPTVRPGTTTRSMLGSTRRRANRLRIAIGVFGLLALGAAGYVLQQRRAPVPAMAQEATAPSSPIRSMAVLPLNNVARNSQDEFLSVSLADALVTKLQQIPSLNVRPTSAVLEFQDRKMDARSASRELQVDGVLEGNFLAAGDLVRVNLQLTDSRSGYSVWAETIDGRRDDLLELIDQVSARTVAALNEKLGVGAVRSQHSVARSSNPRGYEEYLKARALTGSLRREDVESQLSALRRAIDLDPQFAAAYADLAIALSLAHTRGLLTAPDVISRAEGYARQAVRLDTNLPQAHLALGRVFVRYPDRYPESMREILAALRLNANDTHALNSLATYFVSAGDIPKAQCIFDRIIRLDPSSNEARPRGYWYVNAVDPEGALKNAQFALDSEGSRLAGHDIRAVAYILQGNLAGAEAEVDAISAIAPQHYLGKSLRAMIAAARGDAAAARAAVASFEPDAKRVHWAAIRAAHVHARIGDVPAAIGWVERATQLGHHNWYALVRHPWMEPLQSDPRFQTLVGEIRRDIDDVRDDVVGVYALMCK